MDNYLVPANAKKGMLIFGRFTPFDLILALSGILISVLLMATTQQATIARIIISLLPGFITTGLVIPLPNYHNILTAIISAVLFIINRRIYIWKGWCIYEKDKFE